MEYKRVAVTGVGALTCLGLNVEDTWNALIAGKCGIDKVTRFDLSEYRSQIGGEIRNFNRTQYMTEKEARRFDEVCLYAITATREALQDAGLPADFRGADSNINPDRVGVCIGTGIGGIRTMEEQAKILVERGPGRISPFLIPMMIIDMAPGAVSMHVGAKGPNFAVVSACATGCHAIGESFWTIRRGDADIMIAGGTEASISRLGISGFCSMKALSQRNDDPQHASRPFDKDRDGFVMSDGAGILILEDMDHAKKRGAKIYGEIIGFGATGDAYHITSPAPGGEGGARAMKMALENAGIRPEDVDYINAHGTSTHLNDLYETQAIKTAFGEAARKVSISSTKGGMGHTLGAAGGIESIVCLKAMQTGIVPQTINYVTPDPECDLDYTPNTPREREIKVAINTNLGFGGHNGVVIFRKV